jgi:uncharacterized protein GlcG (DUF336 family)
VRAIEPNTIVQSNRADACDHIHATVDVGALHASTNLFKLDGIVIGAVGASGGSVEEDVAVARAALAGL